MSAKEGGEVDNKWRQILRFKFHKFYYITKSLVFARRFCEFTFLGGFESWELGGLFFLQKQKEAKTLNKDFLFDFLTRFCEFVLLGRLESVKLRGILLFAKAKSSKNFCKNSYFILDSWQSHDNRRGGGMAFVFVRIFGINARL